MKIILLLLLTSISLSLFAQNSSDCKFKNRLSFSLDPMFAPFYHGVASGDPLIDAVIIWTRVTPLGQIDSINVEWEMALDTLFNNVVTNGNTWTNENKDFTVKVDVTGLQPSTWYYYRFKALNTYSIIGRTKTFPVGDCDSMRFAAISGSDYNNGYFNALRTMTNKNDIDAIIHLGDYIYEYETDGYGSHPDRALSPSWECLTLSDYRMRYAHYHLDPDLRLAHQQFPWVLIYDDHETANNSWTGGAENHNSGEGGWTDRKNAGVEAYLEWVPIREQHDAQNPNNKIHRVVPIGKLANLIMLDTRLEGRDDPDGLSIDDPNKTILGTQQYNWLTNNLYNFQYGSDTVRWKIIGNQVMMTPLVALGNVLNKDQWDGYRYERQKFLNFIYGWNIKNTVIITGDIHTSWACDVPNQTIGSYGPNGQGVGTVEFVTPSITSPSVSYVGGIGASLIQSSNPYIRWVDLENRGYMTIDVNKLRVQSDWYFVNDINNHDGTIEYLAASWYVKYNEHFIRQSMVPSIRLNPNPPLAPMFPVQTSINNDINDITVLTIAPNPFTDNINIQYYTSKPQTIIFRLFDVNGKLMKEASSFVNNFDIEYTQIPTTDLIEGAYILEIISNNKIIYKKRMIKK